MGNLVPLGVIHTIISVVAVALAFLALGRDKGISLKSRLGLWYVIFLLATCLTGFPILRTGEITPPFILGILTMTVIGVAVAAGKFGAFGRASRYVETVAYSSTVFFLMIPTVTEALTRLPPGDPMVASQENPIFPVLYSVLFVLFLIGSTLQVRSLRAMSSMTKLETHS